jgi:cell division protein FtsZ
MAMSSLSKNLDVTFEIVSNRRCRFYLTPVATEVKQAAQPKAVEYKKRTTFSSDLTSFSYRSKKRKKVLFELTNETRDIKVNQPVQFV